MIGKLLVSPTELAELIEHEDCLVFDCRFDLHHAGRGRNSWRAAHIPGAVYAHLDDDLAARITPVSGRHPLPFNRAFAGFLSRSGWEPGRPVVVYDAQGGAIALRLWWLMRFFGHPDVALLDGGIGAWVADCLPLESGEQSPARRPISNLRSDPGLKMGVQEVSDALEAGQIQLVDARAGERFNGDTEPLDSVAGHVPGAINRPLDLNLAENSHFRSPAELNVAFTRLLSKNTDPESVVHMCGSGVTACHNLFAMELAGLPGSKLYPGSWSEWIRDPQRPVATVDQ